MKLKKVFTIFAFILVSIGASAQGITFLPEGATFQQAVDYAKKEGKKIFLDCYTSWCGPCKKMARDVFPQAEVGEFMNPQFVSIKIDMEKGEGPELMKKFDVTAFPTFIVFNSEGKEIGRWMGGSDVEKFIQRVKDNSVDNSSSTMDERFANGDRDPKFLAEYLESLGVNYKRVQSNEVAEALLDGKAETFASDEYLRKVFMSYLQNPLHSSFVYTAKNPKTLSDAVGNDAVMSKLARVWNNYPRTLIEEKDGTATMDEQKWQTFLNLMEECNVPGRDRIRLTTLLTYAEKRKDWPVYVDHLKEYYANKTLDINDLDLCKLSTPIVKDCTDATLRGEVKKILQDRLAKLRSGEREPLRKIGNMTVSGNMDKAMEMLIGNLSR
jgi:thioredoxin-related protein